MRIIATKRGYRYSNLRPYTTGMLCKSLQGCFAPHIPVLYREVPFILNITACLRWICLCRRLGLSIVQIVASRRSQYLGKEYPAQPGMELCLKGYSPEATDVGMFS